MTHQAEEDMGALIGGEIRWAAREHENELRLVVGVPPQQRMEGQFASIDTLLPARWRVIEGGLVSDSSQAAWPSPELGVIKQLIGKRVDGITVSDHADILLVAGRYQLQVWSSAASRPTFFYYRQGDIAMFVGPNNKCSVRKASLDTVAGREAEEAIRRVTE